jgi:hypothetical protein
LAAPAFVLLHSPLVGPGSWTRVAAILSERGFDAVVPRLSSALDGAPPYYARFAELTAGAVRISAPVGDIVLVGHSGAGALLPVVAAQVPNVAGAIFADALLPHPGKAWFETVHPELKAHLLALTRDGHLPPWNTWWPRDAMARILPDPATRETFVGALREIPIAYCEERAPETAMPDAVRCAYLQWSAACRADAAEAGMRGWTVLSRNANHLAMLTSPDAVADDLLLLTETLGLGVA